MANSRTYKLRPGTLALSDLYALWRGSYDKVAVVPAAWAGVEASASAVQALSRDGRQVYGINTGFGSLASASIPPDQLAELQRRLVLSHCAGVGEPLSRPVTALTLLLKINALSRGYSGIRRLVIERLVGLYNAGALPVVPAKGSVGASGDLAPLAHLSAPLIGHGEIILEGERMPAAAALQRLGLEPLTLQAKEGLALLNGTQVSTALALAGLFAGLDAVAAALAAGALSVDAVLGSDTPFDQRIHALRGQPGQITVAAVMKALLDGSEIRDSHLTCDRVQDPYSLRCQPQVMGAALDMLASAAEMLRREANAVSDNPLVFADDGEILSGGNFHAEPVAFAADMIAIALSEVGALSERRTALLTDAHHSSLPPFLIADPGINSGFMIAHVTAAALVSENKLLAQPASVDSLPTSANQEDHVSMATHGARRLGAIAEHLRAIVAIELLAAAQGIDLRKPLATAPRLVEVMKAVRKRVGFLETDRPLAPDIAATTELINSGWFLEFIWPEGESRPILTT